MKNSIHNPHDKLFRASLQYPEVAKEFLEMYLPIEIKQQVDFNNIAYCNTSFIDEQLKLTQSDVLFKTAINDKESYIYILCEHQFKIDKLMPFRLIKYMVNIWDFHLKQTSKKSTLPLPAIFPLVFYTGEGSYSGCRVFSELFEAQSKLMETILISPFHLINVNELPEESLTSRIWAGTMGFIMRKQFKEHLELEVLKIVDNLNAIGLNKHGQYVVELVKYILNIDDDHRNVEEFVNIMHDKLLPSVEEEIMTLAERIEEKGRKEGLLAGKIEIARKLLQEKTDPVFIAKITELSLEKIKELQKKHN